MRLEKRAGFGRLDNGAIQFLEFPVRYDDPVIRPPKDEHIGELLDGVRQRFGSTFGFDLHRDIGGDAAISAELSIPVE